MLRKECKLTAGTLEEFDMQYAKDCISHSNEQGILKEFKISKLKLRRNSTNEEVFYWALRY